MQIKVNQIESKPNQLEVFVKAFELGQETARKIYGA